MSKLSKAKKLTEAQRNLAARRKLEAEYAELQELLVAEALSKAKKTTGRAAYDENKASCFACNGLGSVSVDDIYGFNDWCRECGSTTLANQAQPKAPRRPLAVGDRVSFEGFAEEGFGRGAIQFVERYKGTLIAINKRKTWAIAKDDMGNDYKLGLRSFRRLVVAQKSPKKTKGSK